MRRQTPAMPLLLSLALAGCVSASGETHNISFDIGRSRPAYVVLAGAEQTPKETVIYGQAALPMTSRFGAFTGGVEARIDVPGQPPLVFHDVRVVPRPKPRKLGAEAFFTIHTGRVLPAGTRVHLVYRNG